MWDNQGSGQEKTKFDTAKQGLGGSAGAHQRFGQAAHSVLRASRQLGLCLHLGIHAISQQSHCDSRLYWPTMAAKLPIYSHLTSTPAYHLALLSKE